MSFSLASSLTIGAWVHNLSPFVVQFSSTFGIRWYGLSYVAGFIVAYFVLQRLGRKGWSPLPAHKVADAMLVLVAGTMIGGRVGYAAFYDSAALTTFTKTFPFWGLLNLSQGGMAYHGALIGVFISSLLVHRWYCTSTTATSAQPGRAPGWSALADVLALACTIGLGLGRFANFVNGELLGKIVAPPGTAGPWWSVRFPQELTSAHAPQLTDAQQQQLSTVLSKHALPSDGNDLNLALDRMIGVIQKGGAAAKQAATDLAPLLASRFPSQLLQAFFEGVLLTGALWVVWRAGGRHKPGVVAACFVLMYGVLRIVAEFYRLPDAQLGTRALGLSRGQWLSVGMVAIGLVWLIFALRKPNDPHDPAAKARA